ncbi:MAG: major facilitator superfamily protein [Rhodocyclaceae bacterium]|nr:MAG: major facilitator superfamily protein [Rhodocyclaceae bacterium]TND06052.1 MAG: major facilitator superfamily protein [Rhodocyclaceae bacterium]
MNHSPPPEPLDPTRERMLLITLAGIQFAHILDFMVMMPLGPILMRELAVGTHEFGLLVSAYTFTAAFTGVLAAAFVDRFERKRMLLTMFALFALATLACGLAPGYLTLLVARGTAGAFGGVLGSMVQTMVGDLIPFERRGRASGTIMSAFSLSTVAGVPLSLYLANHFGWRFPFIFIAVLSCGLLLLGWKMLPALRGHLPTAIVSEAERAHPLAAMRDVLRDANHLRALLFMALIMFSGFSVIPYITIYVTANIGIRQEDIPLIYLAGGCATFFTSRLIGRLADAHGKIRVYRWMALCSMVPLFAQTHLGPVPLWLMIIWSTLFFILVPGRMVPVMAIVTSAVQPRLRGTFLSMNGAVQQLAAGTASYIGGVMITADASGHIVGYGMVGWMAIGATLAAMAFVGQIDMHTGMPPGRKA